MSQKFSGGGLWSGPPLCFPSRCLEPPMKQEKFKTLLLRHDAARETLDRPSSSHSNQRPLNGLLSRHTKFLLSFPFCSHANHPGAPSLRGAGAVIAGTAPRISALWMGAGSPFFSGLLICALFLSRGDPREPSRGLNYARLAFPSLQRTFISES